MRHNFLKRALGTCLLSTFLVGHVSLVCAQTKQAAPSLSTSRRWRTYHNVRFGYSLSYPASFLIPQGEADNGDGQQFRAKNAAMQLWVYGSYNVLEETIRSRFAANQHSDTKGASRRIVTYAQQKGNWYVISGYRNETIFYQKCYQIDDRFITLEIEYPKTKRASYDKIVSRIVHEFEPGV